MEHMAIDAARAVYTEGDSTSARTSNHLLFVKDAFFAVETFEVVFFGSQSDVHIMPVVASWINHVIGFLHSQHATMLLVRLKDLVACIS